MAKRPSASQPSAPYDRLRGLMADLFIEALNFVPQARVADAAQAWMSRATRLGDPAAEASLFADAVGLASDLAMFTPSASGSTAFDRLARQRKTADSDEHAAVEALRQARLRIMSIQAREDQSALRLLDLASGETIRVIDEDIPDSCLGVSVVGRAASLGDGNFALVGAIAPLDETALALALSFRRPDGRGLSNPQRCAEAVYRHVVRHGGPEFPGLNRPLDYGEEDDIAFGPETSELDRIAHEWAGLDAAAAPPANALQQVRDLTSVDHVIDALASSVMMREHRRDSLADAYARVAAIQVETIRLREANGMSGVSLASLSTEIARAIAKQGMPASVRTLFEQVQRQARPARAASPCNADLNHLIQRIQGLRAKTTEQGCTEPEALAAAEKVAELLDRYGLSLSEIEVRQQACQGIGIDTGRRRLGPIDDCVPTIAAFFDCRAWSEKPASAPIRHVFFGLRADVEAAHYLYDLVARAFATETGLFARGELYAELGSGERRSATNSFQIGLGRGITAKLLSLRREREAGVLAVSSNALVPLKAAVVEDELARLGLHFRPRGRTGKRFVMTDAYEAGEAAGARFEYIAGLEAA